jgi:hypothetical protein
MMKELLIKILDFIGWAYWVEIVTEHPACTYYFGPFVNQQEAEAAQSGYIEDLRHEGAQEITLTVKRCKPDKLTIFNELGEFPTIKGIPTLSGQIS